MRQRLRSGSSGGWQLRRQVMEAECGVTDANIEEVILVVSASAAEGLVAGKLVAGKIVAGKIVAGKLVAGKIVAGAFSHI